MINFFIKQLSDIKKNGTKILINKLKILFHNIYKLFIYFPFYILGIPFVLIIRILSPFLLIRIGCLISSRIGHLSGNTELYLCEKENKINVPKQKYLDVFYNGHHPICNKYLSKKISKILIVLPKIFLKPISVLNRTLPNWKIFEIDQNTQHDRDVHNLLDKSKKHFFFSDYEIKNGNNKLLDIGIPIESKVVCLFVRDSSYLSKQFGSGYDYHNYRDCDIENYLKASEKLTEMGYYIVRMGAVVKNKIKTKNKMIIDYAASGKRTEFLDIFLAYRCSFVITSSAGWDNVPSHLFRKPILYTNVVPVGLLLTFSSKFMLTTRRYFDTKNKMYLNFSDVYKKGYAFYTKSNLYEKKNLSLIENNSDEIYNAVLDMVNFISNNFNLSKEDKALQMNFWKNFPKNKRDNYYKGNRLHGKIKAVISPSFLKNNYHIMNC